LPSSRRFNIRPPGKEGNTTDTEEIHLAHLLRILGSSTALPDIPGKLQSYATARSAEKNRQGEHISQVTVRKELGTLTSLWNRWATRQGRISSNFWSDLMASTPQPRRRLCQGSRG